MFTRAEPVKAFFQVPVSDGGPRQGSTSTTASSNRPSVTVITASLINDSEA